MKLKLNELVQKKVNGREITEIYYYSQLTREAFELVHDMGFTAVVIDAMVMIAHPTANKCTLRIDDFKVYSRGAHIGTIESIFSKRSDDGRSVIISTAGLRRTTRVGTTSKSVTMKRLIKKNFQAVDDAKLVEEARAQLNNLLATKLLNRNNKLNRAELAFPKDFIAFARANRDAFVAFCGCGSAEAQDWLEKLKEFEEHDYIRAMETDIKFQDRMQVFVALPEGKFLSDGGVMYESFEDIPDKFKPSIAMLMLGDDHLSLDGFGTRLENKYVVYPRAE